MPLKVGLHKISTLAQFNALAEAATAENKRLVAVLGDRGYTIRVVSGHNFLTKIAGYLTGQTEREKLILENFKNALTGNSGPPGAPALSARRASNFSLSGSFDMDAQSIDHDGSEDDPGSDLPLQDLNDLLSSALQDSDAAKSNGTLRSIFSTCMKLRREPEIFREIAQAADLKVVFASSHRPFKAHLLLNDLEKNFKHLSAAIDLSPSLRQEFQMYQPIIGDVIEIIGSQLSHLDKTRGAIQGLHDELTLHGLTMLKPSNASGSSSESTLVVDFSRIAPGSELLDLLSRVSVASNAYVFESALTRIDQKIEELTQVTRHIKASARRHEPYLKIFEGSIASWEFSAKTLQEIRNRVSEAYQVKFPSQWQGSDSARFCGELIQSGPQICADLLMQVINPATQLNAPNPASIGTSISQQAPLLAQFLSECPNESSIASHGRSELARSSNCLGLLQAKIDAAGQHLIAYRRQLQSSTSSNSARLKEYDEAISRLATLNVLLVIRTNQTVANLNSNGQFSMPVSKWAENLNRQMRDLQDACHSLLNASPAPIVVLKSVDSSLKPVIARANGSYETPGFPNGKTYIGENPVNLSWDFAVAKAWRNVRASEFRDDDLSEQFQAGMDFLGALVSPSVSSSSAT